MFEHEFQVGICLNTNLADVILLECTRGSDRVSFLTHLQVLKRVRF